jgi:tetratricopeptide (TPR) repeat protein
MSTIASRVWRAVRLGGWVWLGSALLLVGATSGWLDAPLGGSIPGHRVPLNADALQGQALVSFGLLFAVAAVVAVGAAIAGVPRALGTHLGAAVLVGALSFPIAVLMRNPLLLDTMTSQGRDREAIRRFAEFVGGYSAGLPPRELAGTATLADRVSTTVQVLGWGWWLALAGALVLILAGLGRPARRAWIAGVTGWGLALIAVVGVIAAPGAVAEYRWAQAEELYAAGHYPEALARFDDVLAWSPDLRDNGALQYRRGAAEFWLAGATSPGARGFLAENLRRSGDVESALDLVGRPTLQQPGWGWLRRNLAQTFAEIGVREARRQDQFATATARWLRAREIDEGLVPTHYYLAHAYHRLHGRHQERAIAEAGHLMTVVRDAAIRSDVLAFLGDCHFRAERDAEARALYRRSLAVVPLFSRVNLQAQKGLLGL